MSRHYLLDGYNIIKQNPQLANKSLADGRSLLIAWINNYQPQGSVNNEVTVVFDGNNEFFDGHPNAGMVKVLFSQYGSADDVIKKIVEEAPDRKRYIVVSNDKGIVLYVRALGATTLNVENFAKELTQPKVIKTNPASKYISLQDQDKINKEFSKIWLKDK